MANIEFQNLDGMKFTDVSFRCLQCEDTGWVSIWHPHTIDKARRGVELLWWKTVAVACTCEKAQEHADTIRRGSSRHTPRSHLPVFGDADWHIEARHPDAKAKAAIYEPKPEGFYDEFQEYA